MIAHVVPIDGIGDATEMTREPLAQRIVERIGAANTLVALAQAQSLADYLSLLARWNRRMNLTALPTDPPSDAAIDRLVVEPVIGAALVSQEDRTLIDVGSGAGSPAIPLKIMCPWLRVEMIEVRARKAAFLRAAVRELLLAGCRVEARTFGETTETERHRSVLSVRAVRIDAGLIGSISESLAPESRFIHFGAPGPSSELPPGMLVKVAERELPGGSVVRVYSRTTQFD